MRAFFVAGVAVLLAACAGQPTRKAPPLTLEQQAAHARAYQAERAQLRGAWTLSGRIAVSANGRGGSGRIDWTQAGDRSDIALSAPVTRQSWRLSGDATSARLEGLEGGPREGSDAGQLLEEATGWTIPVDCLSDWVLGFSCRRWTSPVQGITWREDGLPASIEQMGWVIEYQDWHEAADGQPALPKRIFARSTSDKATVRLVIDQWQPQGGPGAAAQPATGWNHHWSVALAGADGEGSLDGGVGALATELGSRNLRDPEADMRRQVAAGDTRPLGVCGYSCETPGLPEIWSGERPRVLDHTGDVIRSNTHAQLKSQADEYARRYNQALVKWLATTEAERRKRP